MISTLKVEVAKDRWGEKKRCYWLGHASYKCAGCRLGYLKVKSETEFDTECSECKFLVFVEREVSK